MLKTLIAICIATLVLGAFLFLNADGHPVYLVRAPLYWLDDNSSPLPPPGHFEVKDRRLVKRPYWIPYWIHGWPIVGLIRPMSEFGDSTPTSRWPFDSAPWYLANYTALAFNALIMVIVTVDAFFSTRRMLASRFRLSISWLMASLFIAAVISTFREILFVQLDWQERTAVGVAAIATLATAIHFIHALTRMVLNRLTRPKNETDGEFG